MKKKYVGIWVLLLAIITVSVPFGVWKALAGAEPPYQIKVLEVVDNGAYALRDALAGTDNVKVDTMRMKTFTALRDELEGKYDAVYFGEGAYSTKPPQTFTSSSGNAQREAHNTTNLMNDITKLKVGEVENAYILKGLPVIFHASIANQNPKGNLYALYSKYADDANRPSNTIFVPNATALVNTVAKNIKSGNALYKQRPRVEIISKPADFLAGSTKIYTTGDTLTFTFNANNVKDFNTPVNAKLYASVDKALPLSEENVVASTTLTSRGGELTYKLPQTFSGPIYWKLEISANGLSDYAEGAFRVHDKQTVIRVLQVMPKYDTSSLRQAVNMTQSYLKTDDYDIQITPILFNAFNTASNPDSYANLNGKYDMVIFGFVDSYNTQTAGSLTDAAAAEVNKFINTGQAVMFTHDTMFGNSSNNWIKNFQKTTGQTGLFTNFGLSAVNPSTRTKIVNNGILTQFPFDLSLAPSNPGGYVGQIALTHNQYYMLDLEDPEIIPWYNIVSEDKDSSAYKRDGDDSYDHYYTYSKGNVTYSGTGHTSTKFPEWEQKLFVNTMFRAFIGSNHAPTITVLAPTADETTKQSYLSDLTFSYQVDDLDLKDVNVYSSVRFKVNEKYVDSMAIKEKTIQKGQVITETFANPLTMASGTVQIEITAHDKQGAKVVKTIDLKVEKVTANLQTDRTIDNADANSEFKIGDTVNMTYKVTPQEIAADHIRVGEKGLKTLEISNIIYNETIPAGLRLVSPLPTGITASGSPETGYTLTRNLDKVTYALNAAGNRYVPNANSATTFTLGVVPVKKGYFSLTQARLQYDDIHAPAGNTSSVDSTEALKLLKGYGLITLGGDMTTISGGTIQGRALFNGPASLSGFDIGTQELGEYDASFPAVSANGDLSITNGSINKGPIVTTGSFTSSQFGFNNTVIMAGKDVTLNGNNGLSSSSVWAGRNFNLVNYNIGNSLKFYAVENFNMTGGGNSGGLITYGGVSNVNDQYVTKSSISALTTQFNTQKNTSNAKGVSDFAAVKQQLTNMSNAYASLSPNSLSALDESRGSVVIKGENSDLNVFDIDAAAMNNLIALRNSLIIEAPANSTMVLNIKGGNVNFSGGFKLAGGITPDRVIINYTGSGSVTISNVALQGTVLAPQSTVNFLGGDVYGTIVAGIYKTSGSTKIHLSRFAGAAPSTPAAEPITPERPIIRFRDAHFNVISKVTSITLSNQSIWVGDTLKMIPTIAPADADNKKVTWRSTNESILTVRSDDSLESGTILGVRAGTATIIASAVDGSGVQSAPATITVEAPGIEIKGSTNVNVDETITDLQVLPAGTSRQLSNIQWSLIGAADAEKASLVGAVNGPTVSLRGLEAGTVTLKVTATMIHPVTGISKPFSTTAPINVLNPLSNAVITGPTWVEVGRSIDLNTEVYPTGVHLSSIQWQIGSGAAHGSLSSTDANRVAANNTFTGTDTPGLAAVEAVFTTRGESPITVKASKDIRVVDLQISGPQQMYIGRSDTLNAVFATYQPENWTDKPSNYSWTVANLTKDANDKLIVDTSNSAPHATFEGSSASTATPTIVADSLGGYIRVTLNVGEMSETKDIQIVPYLQQLQLRSPIDLYVGETVNLQNEINLVPGSVDLDAILPLLKWTSSNSLIATAGDAPLTKGLITGVKEGTARITVIYPSPDGVLPAVSVSTVVNVRERINPINPDNPGGGNELPTGGDRY